VSLFRLLAARLALPDAQQYLGLYLIALLFALVATWPTVGTVANDSWFALAYTRAAMLGLLGIGFGVTASPLARREQRLTALMLGCFALLALPFEVVAYAASYPATPLAWLLALPPLASLAMYSVGLVLGLLLDALRLRVVAPLIVPAALVAMVALDVGLGYNLVNPFTGAVRVSWAHLAILLALIGALLAMLLRPPRGAAS
jgi:hypothetical protein